jgi:electron transfer flavoprotein beta subunit
MLGLPSVNVITSIEIDGTTANVERDIDGGREKLTASLPLVVSAQKELTEPRIPNMRGIMAARTKPLTVIEPIAIEATSTSVGFELPASKGSVKLISVEDAGTLIGILHNEAKII